MFFESQMVMNDRITAEKKVPRVRDIPRKKIPKRTYPVVERRARDIEKQPKAVITRSIPKTNPKPNPKPDALKRINSREKYRASIDRMRASHKKVPVIIKPSIHCLRHQNRMAMAGPAK